MTGDELKSWRTRSGLTQAQLAEQLGVTSNTIARWERDEMSIPTHVNLSAISKSPQNYIRRVMNEYGLTVHQISERSRRLHHRISVSSLHLLMTGNIKNPGIYTIKALAVGLGRPESEVFAAFGVGIEKNSLTDPDLEAIEINYSRLPSERRRQLKPVLTMLSREIQHLLKE